TMDLDEILQTAVKGSQPALDRLDGTLEAKAWADTILAFASGNASLPASLDQATVVAAVDALRQANAGLDYLYQDVKKVVAIAPLADQGDIKPAVRYNPGM